MKLKKVYFAIHGETSILEAEEGKITLSLVQEPMAGETYVRADNVVKGETTMIRNWTGYVVDTGEAESSKKSQPGMM